MRSSTTIFDAGNCLYSFPFTGKIVEPVFVMPAPTASSTSPVGKAVYIDRQTLQAENIGRLPQMADAHCPSPHYLSMRMSNLMGQIWLTTASSGVYKRQVSHRSSGSYTAPSPVRQASKGMPTGQRRGMGGFETANLYVLSPAEGRLRQTYGTDRYGIGSVSIISCKIQGAALAVDQGRWSGDGCAHRMPRSRAAIGLLHHRHQRSDLASLSGNDVYMTYERRHRIWVCTSGRRIEPHVREHDGRIGFWNKHHGMGRYPGYGLYMAQRVVEDRRGGRILSWTPLSMG